MADGFERGGAEVWHVSAEPAPRGLWTNDFSKLTYDFCDLNNSFRTRGLNRGFAVKDLDEALRSEAEQLGDFLET